MDSPTVRPSWASGRVGPALGVALIHALLGYAFIAGLKVTVVGSQDDEVPLVVVNLKPPIPLPSRREPPRKVRHTAKPGGGAAAAPKSRNDDMVEAPPAPLPTAPPPPIVALPAPARASAIGDAGGLGSGGGTGAGTGTGEGSGEGAGVGGGIGDGGEFTSARQIRGRFRNSDFPASARNAGRLRIGVRYAVAPSGHVDRCEIIAPSGYAEVDAMTCRVIVERYRFKPARDGQGNPVTEVLEEDYSWRMD